MKVLVTGNLGYIGTELARVTKEYIGDVKIAGIDSGLFTATANNSLRLGDTYYDVQIFKDVRDLTVEDVYGYDVVIALAAVSNDPIGKDFEAATKEINQDANLRLAHLCLAAHVSKLVIASSCSVYGSGGSNAKVEDDAKDPLTAYARSKVGTEELVYSEFKERDIEVIFLRFATACGISDRMRLDLVLNDFVASAITRKRIDILSDGSPWRPLIDVRDICKSIVWALRFSPKYTLGKNVFSVNVGRSSNNYSIKSLAEMVSEVLGGIQVMVNSNALPDRRSYKVDFSLYEGLAGEFCADGALWSTIERLNDLLRSILVDNEDYHRPAYIRLMKVKELISCDLLDEGLRWR